MDTQNQVCLPGIDVARIPVLGDDGNWRPGEMGAEKVVTAVRRQSVAVAYTQAAAVGDPLIHAGQQINVLAYGGPIANQNGNAGTLAGFPAGFGNIDYQRSNLYPGGLMCQPEFEFVIVALGIRVKPGYRVPAGVITRGKFVDSYQSEAQQLILENTVWTFQRNRETCQILGDTLAMYPSNFSSGMPCDSSQNGEKLRGNIIPLCVGLPVGAESGTAVGAAPNASMTFTTRAHTLSNDPFNQPATQLTAADPLIFEYEIEFFGYCREYCPPTNCPPGGRRQRAQQIPG